MNNQKISIAADCVAEKLAAILEAVEKDYTDEAHRTEPGTFGRSRVVLGGVHNAREYLTGEFLALLEEAQDALADYKKAVEEYKPEPRKFWIALTVNTDEADPEYVAVASAFSTKEKAQLCVENAVAEDTSEGGTWDAEDVQWNTSRTICEYKGGSVVHRIAQMTIQE